MQRPESVPVVELKLMISVTISGHEVAVKKNFHTRPG